LFARLKTRRFVDLPHIIEKIPGLVVLLSIDDSVLYSKDQDFAYISCLRNLDALNRLQQAQRKTQARGVKPEYIHTHAFKNILRAMIA